MTLGLWVGLLLHFPALLMVKSEVKSHLTFLHLIVPKQQEGIHKYPYFAMKNVNVRGSQLVLSGPQVKQSA